MSPATRVIRTEFARGEVVTGIVWLSVFGALGGIFSSVYLGTSIGLGNVSLPWTVPASFGGVVVLTKTASLWSPKLVVQLMPAAAWLGVAAAVVSGINSRAVWLGCAIVAGVMWQVVRSRLRDK